MKHAGVDAATAARQWTHYNIEAARVRRYLPPESWMMLHYEELCADPGAMLDRIAAFLGVGRATLNLNPRDRNRHVIGNPMRLKALNEIREDLSWETRLSPGELEVITRITGPVSRTLGFRSAGRRGRKTAPMTPTPPGCRRDDDEASPSRSSSWAPGGAARPCFTGCWRGIPQVMWLSGFCDHYPTRPGAEPASGPGGE